MNPGQQKRGIRTVILLFSVFSVLLLATAWYASSLAPRLMTRNYRTIKYTAEMQSALTAIYLAAANAKEPSPAELSRFEQNLASQKNNITENEEPESVASLEAQWSEFRKFQGSATIEAFQKLSKSLEKLAAINERAMFAYEERARTVSYSVLFGGVLGFVLVLIYALQIYLHLTLD